MSLQNDFDRMIQRQGLGHGNFPVFENPLMLGDVVQWRPAQKVPVKRQFNAVHAVSNSEQLLVHLYGNAGKCRVRLLG